jgi:hypothetical protein
MRCSGGERLEFERPLYRCDRYLAASVGSRRRRVGYNQRAMAVVILICCNRFSAQQSTELLGGDASPPRVVSFNACLLFGWCFVLGRARVFVADSV